MGDQVHWVERIIFGWTVRHYFALTRPGLYAITAFNDNFRETFYAVRDVCNKLNLKCVRGDEEFVPNDIFPSILRQIIKSRLVIANITGRNPNVMYELGVAHALGKPTIIVSQNFAEIPFDINNKRIIIYNNLNDLKSRLCWCCVEGIGVAHHKPKQTSMVSCRDGNEKGRALWLILKIKK